MFPQPLGTGKWGKHQEREEDAVPQPLGSPCPTGQAGWIGSQAGRADIVKEIKGLIRPFYH